MHRRRKPATKILSLLKKTLMIAIRPTNMRKGIQIAQKKSKSSNYITLKCYTQKLTLNEMLSSSSMPEI
jgi:hypothetical protein